jgi:transcriptional regulator with XRE-family HTH domain
MTDGATGSTVPRRQLGRYLRELRNQARFTVRAAAGKLEWSEGKMWRIETGQTSLRSLDVEAMCRLYDAPAELTKDLMRLARETKSRGWWHSYSDVVSEGFDLFIGLEAAASTISSYMSELVPGLLQTEEHYRAQLAIDELDPAAVDRLVAVRSTRQALITRSTDPASLRAVLNEAVLRRPIGHLPAAQLTHLVEMSALPNVAIRVIPFRAGGHPGMMSGPFEILQFSLNGDGRPTEPPVVYIEGFAGALYLEKPSEIEQYQNAFDRIWNMALDEDASMTFISDLAKEAAR